MAGRNLGEEQISSVHESKQWDSNLLKIRLWNFFFGQTIEFHKHASEIVFLEIFAGSGDLSTAVKDINLSVHAIDNKAQRQSQVSIHVLDLTKQCCSTSGFDVSRQHSVGTPGPSLRKGT